MGELLPPVVERMYDVTRWVIAKVGAFPRDQRFLLGQRIVTVCLDVLEGLIQAAFMPAGDEKLTRVRALNSRLDVLRYLLRLARDLRLIDLAAWEYVVGELLRVGRMLGGWTRV
jgi:hypothetical protein